MSVSSHPEYREDIDGLRAVAILLVAVFHFRLLPLGDAGFIGVDIFFVISGFLITRILMRDLEAGRLSLGPFYLARLRRLMPALLATLVLYFALAAFVFLPDKFAELSREALLTQLYGINFYFWRTINYFGLHADDVPLLHMWSLAVEEQFYLIYPIILMVLFRWGRRFVLPALVLATVGSFALGWWATGWKPEASFYLLPTRAWELSAGAILALLPSLLAPSGLGAICAGIAGAGLIALALLLHTPITPFPGWFAALPVAGAALLILAGPATPTGRLMSLAPMRWIGWISYPLYLVHWPVLQLMQAGLPDVATWHRWAGFAVSVLLAWAIWRYVEIPVRFGAALRAPQRLLGALGAATGGLAAVSLVGLLTQGLPGRIAPEAQALLAYQQDLPIPFLMCEAKADAGDAAPCPLGIAEGPVTVAVIGDSHAQAFAGALDLWLKQAERRGQLWFHHSCIPMVGAGQPACPPFMERTLAILADTPEITHVLLISPWRHDPRVYEGRYLSGAAADEAFSRAMSETLDRLAAPRRQLVLVDPMFSPRAHVPERMAQNIVFDRALPLSIRLDEHKDRYHALDRIFSDLDAARPNVARISLISGLCATGTCQATLDGAPLFSDGSHVRFGVSDYFADRLGEALSLSNGDTK